MTFALIYHWWSEPNELPPSQNIRTPILCSIATFRAVNPKTPIYVLDGSDDVVDWGGLDHALNFKVIRHTPGLHRYSNKPGWKNLSRLFDLQTLAKEIPEPVLAYTDADVFWLRPITPFNHDPHKFCFNRYNSGFFYFDKNSPTIARFFEVFNAFAITALNDENFRIITRQYTDYREWYYVLDETILTYMAYKLPDLFNILGIEEHLTVSTECEAILCANLETIKMLHLHGVKVSNRFSKHNPDHNRGLACIVIKELYDNLRQTLDDKTIRLLYGDDVLNYYLPFQVSVLDRAFLERLLKTKNDNGHYDLMASLAT